MTGTEGLEYVAAHVQMSPEWTRKHWREIKGFPAPICGSGPRGRLRWRKADLERYFNGENFSQEGTPANDAAPVTTVEQDDMVNRLLKASGA